MLVKIKIRRILRNYVPDFMVKYYKNCRNLILGLIHRGDKVVCLICGHHFNEFGTFGLSHRRNALCYYCGSLERHRLLWKYWNDKANLFDETDKRLLHFAPERMFYNIFSKTKQIEYVPCDLFPENYNYKGNVRIIKVDITNIPFADNSFDVIMCNHVLEHVLDDRLAMSELYRVMKKGAYAILQVPIDYNRKTTYEDLLITTPEDREKAFGQYDHVRVYGRDYIDRLKSVGFNVIEDNFVKSFSAEEVFKFGFMIDELIYVAQKK